MNILAIESSCDETAAAIVFGDLASDQPPQLLSNVVVSQIDIFKSYGGVIPEVAARSHLETILPVIHQAMKDAGITKAGKDDWSKIDAIAVTHTPGLLGSLLIGTLTARTLAILHDKPLYAVHHLKSHIYANWLGNGNEGNTISAARVASPESELQHSRSEYGTEIPAQDRLNVVISDHGAKQPETQNSVPSFPLLALVISGGHTQIIYMKKHNQFEIIGTTLDDAVGECFDKVAKILGLPYPGGPSIAQAANGKLPNNCSVSPGDPRKYRFPHPNVQELDFSFSGLKTAVLRAVQQELNKPTSFPSHQLAPLLSEQQKADFAASFQDTAVDILLEKLKKALKKHPEVKNIVIAGGVSANEHLRWKSQKFSTKNAVEILFPEPKFSGDNAAMVGIAAFYEQRSKIPPTDPYKLNILPRSEIK